MIGELYKQCHVAVLRRTAALARQMIKESALLSSKDACMRLDYWSPLLHIKASSFGPQVGSESERVHKYPFEN